MQPASDVEEPDRFLRGKQVAALLGISRHTLARIRKRDPQFPRFIELSPGISIVREREVWRWLRKRELAARTK